MNHSQHQLNCLQIEGPKESPEGVLRPNVSGRARNGTPKHVSLLYDVPSYRLKATCLPSNLTSVTIRPPNGTRPHVRFSLSAVSPFEGPEMIRFHGEFGVGTEILTRKSLADFKAMYPAYKYPLIALTGANAWIGSFHFPGNETADRLQPTKRYGDLTPFRQSNTNFPGSSCQDDSYNLTFWGVTCRFEKYHGRATIKREDWSVVEARLKDEELVVGDYRLMLNWQIPDSFEGGVRGTAPGLGGHLLRAALKIHREADLPGWDIETLVDAFLSYEVELRQAILDAAAVNKSDDRFYTLQLEQLYNMTFVPWLLLAGLSALGAACVLTVGLSLSSLKAQSLRSGRVLDAIRLTADVGMALDKEVFERVSGWDGDKLNACAESARFKYEEEETLDEKMRTRVRRVRLRLVSGPHHD